jgi:hypothetical protein
VKRRAPTRRSGTTAYRQHRRLRSTPPVTGRQARWPAAVRVAGLAALILAVGVAASIAFSPQNEPPRAAIVAPLTGASQGRASPDTDPTRIVGELSDLKPQSLAELLAIPTEDLGRVDILRANLLCAEGLPGAENINIEAYSDRLDAFTAFAAAETQRHLYRARHPQYRDHYRASETYLRCEFLAQTLTEHFGMAYNMERFWNPEFRDSRDQFLHGLLDPDHPGGTCVSIPVLVTAAGRRLGYPLFLALAREHVFARWEGPGDEGRPMTLNLETNGQGFDSYTDAFYRRGPSRPITDEELDHRELLVSLTPAEELSVFLLARGHCLLDNNRPEEALEAYRHARRYAPTFDSTEYFVQLGEAAVNGDHLAFAASHPYAKTAKSKALQKDEVKPYLWRP